MLSSPHRMSRLFALLVVFIASALGQSADITGWSDLPWGTTKSVALKSLQRLRAHECKRTDEAPCGEAAGVDALAIDDYRSNGISFTVQLVFLPRYGLGKVILIADQKGDAFERELSRLKARYGKPGLQSEYDGEEEVLHTTWTWLKAHGTASLDSEERTGIFTIRYEARR